MHARDGACMVLAKELVVQKAQLLAAPPESAVRKGFKPCTCIPPKLCLCMHHRCKSKELAVQKQQLLVALPELAVT